MKTEEDGEFRDDHHDREKREKREEQVREIQVEAKNEPIEDGEMLDDEGEL